MIAATIIALCSWNNPGADPTTSSVEATLAAMGIKSPELVAKIKASEYSELVTFHKGDHRARGMTSGNAKWCDGEIDTSRWTADQAEQGRVYRVPGVPAVVWYWRCKNMSLWVAEPIDVGVLVGPTYENGVDLVPAGPIGSGPGYSYVLPSAPSVSEPDYGGVGWGGGSFGGGYVINYVSCPACCPPKPPVTTPVPEPATWALMALGAFLVIWKKR